SGLKLALKSALRFTSFHPSRELQCRQDPHREDPPLPKRREAKRAFVSQLQSRVENPPGNRTPRGHEAARLSLRKRASEAGPQSSDAGRAKGHLQAQCR